MAKLTHQYRIYPYGSQIQTLETWLVLCQKLYNAAIEERKGAWKKDSKIGYPEQQKELTGIRAEFPEYQEIPVHVLQNVLLRLDRAYENFFRRCKERKQGRKVKPGFPKFRSRDRYKSITCPDKYNYVRDGNLFFPKIGKIRMEMHRPLPEDSTIKSCTIIKKADGWYVSFSLEVAFKQPLSNTRVPIGIDVGLENFVTLSDGTTVDSPKFLQKSEKALRRAQRKLSGRVKGSRRRNKQRIKVAKMHLKVARQRQDFQRKLASELAKNHSLIAVEDLSIKNMVQNHNLAKSTSDAGWFNFRQSLEHAAVKAGSRVVAVDPRKTSQTCSGCGKVTQKSLSERWHSCACGASLHRDHNAAKNILALGVRRDTPELTLVESRPAAFRYKRKVRPLVEARTVPEKSHV